MTGGLVLAAAAFVVCAFVQIQIQVTILSLFLRPLFFLAVQFVSLHFTSLHLALPLFFALTEVHAPGSCAVKRR